MLRSRCAVRSKETDPGIRSRQMARRLTFIAVVALAWVVVSSAPSGQTTSSRERKGTAERVRVHARSLEGNVVGDSADRDVSVYLPPSYSSGSMRYPVLYVLHGFTDDDKWFGRRDGNTGGRRRPVRNRSTQQTRSPRARAAARLVCRYTHGRVGELRWSQGIAARRCHARGH